MCGGLAALAALWCFLALALGTRWASGLMVGGFLAMVTGMTLHEVLRERRRTAWITSGEALRSLEALEEGFARIAGEIAERLGQPLASPLRGASLPRHTLTAALETLDRTAREVTKAVNGLGRCLAGGASARRTRALLADLKGAIAPALSEMANLQARSVRPEDEEGHWLLVATFAGVLRQIGDWAALGRDRTRITRDNLIDGRFARVEHPLALVLPSEFQSLLAWLRARGWQDEEEPDSRSVSGPSSTTCLLAGLAAGSLLGGHGHSGDSGGGG